jgi:RNase P subunit RPR2
MAKNILHLGDKGYGSDHLIKAMKDYTCKWCEKDIHKGNLYARHSPNKFVEPLTPVCRDCAWWLKVKNQP